MRFTKNLFVLVLFLCHLTAHAQMDTMVVYEVATKTVKLIPPVVFDTAVAFEQTSFSIGSLSNKTALSLTPPVSDLLPGSNFSDIKPAEQFFNLTDYPIRTATSFMTYKNEKLSPNCSGMMVSENIVLTAAHCLGQRIPNGEFQWYADSIFIAPAFNNGKLQPGLKASIVKRYYVFKSFYDNNYGDVALLELKQPIGLQVGWVGIGFNADTSFYSANVFHKLSYPGVPNLIDTSKKYNSDTLYYNYGKINNIYGELGIITPALSIPGQSGSSFLYTDNATYYSVGTLSYTAYYLHQKINNKIFYQLKNIITNYSTGVSENNNNSNTIIIYPNPATISVTIKSGLIKKGKYNLILINLQGQHLCYKPIEFLGRYNLDVTTYPNGIYFLTLQSAESTQTQKLVIQR